jgi:hypothetical protein
MSISAVGGASPVQSHVAPSKPESSEVAGAQDHDGDSEDAGAKVAAVSASSAKAAGRLDVKA